MKKRLAAVIAVALLAAGGLLWYLWLDLDGYPDVRAYGTIPAEFRELVKDDFLRGLTLQEDVLTGVENTGESKIFTQYDYYGNVLNTFEFFFESTTEYEYQSGVAMRRLENGYLVILDDNSVVGRTENGNDLSFIMHDLDGNFLWEYSVKAEDRYRTWLHEIMETPDGHYFWLKESWIDTTYEVVCLDAAGQERFVKELDVAPLVTGDTSFCEFYDLTYADGVFSGYLVNNDGTDLFVVMDTELNVLSVTEQEKPLDAIGVVDGEAVRYGYSGGQYVGEGILEDYPYGTPLKVLDYGEFYLVYSWQFTGVNYAYRGEAIIGSRPMRTQNIYAAFDKTGQLLWIGTVDATRYE